MKGGLQSVGIHRCDQVAGSIVGIGGRVLSGPEPVVDHRAEPVEAVIRVINQNTVRVRRAHRGHISSRIVAVIQRALRRGLRCQPIQTVVGVVRRAARVRHAGTLARHVEPNQIPSCPESGPQG